MAAAMASGNMGNHTQTVPLMSAHAKSYDGSVRRAKIVIAASYVYPILVLSGKMSPPSRLTLTL